MQMTHYIFLGVDRAEIMNSSTVIIISIWMFLFAKQTFSCNFHHSFENDAFKSIVKLLTKATDMMTFCRIIWISVVSMYDEVLHLKRCDDIVKCFFHCQGRIYIVASRSMAPGPEVKGGPFESTKKVGSLFY